MTTEPGDLVLDPTCASGTTAYVAEQCGKIALKVINHYGDEVLKVYSI